VLACELEAAVVAVPDEEPEPLEELPHAAKVIDAANAGRKSFRVRRIGTPLAGLAGSVLALSSGQLCP
jgi:hypothetical protein